MTQFFDLILHHGKLIFVSVVLFQLFHDQIEPVFQGVFGPAMEPPGDLRPLLESLIAQNALQEYFVLI